MVVVRENGMQAPARGFSYAGIRRSLYGDASMRVVGIIRIVSWGTMVRVRFIA